MPGRSRRYMEVREKVKRDKLYGLDEAMNVLKSTASAKFDETVEVAVKLGIDPKKNDQQIRGSLSLPNGTGRNVRIAVFADGEDARMAKEAGADIVGAEDLVEKIQKENFVDFDVAISTPKMMRSVGKLGRLLGPRGLMPSPKSGTVTQDIATAVKEFKKGKISFRNDKFAGIHIPIGKISFDDKKLRENLLAFISHLISIRPPAVKGKYIQKVALSTTMGPGIKLDTVKLQGELVKR